ncbi:carboxypeptidase-like regulatory domain-containing protein [Hymenobacter psoromatis]|uniref:carboxypeptidase-like regulatory domain-containing protein n=1 Tax=Hymenobacter psoromatis TaxID=1484116 RepID=UPI001CBE53D4|nr:carboxypeptidase-like regulatory domain-containing protein [Hymenobacter psoromatis]
MITKNRNRFDFLPYLLLLLALASCETTHAQTILTGTARNAAGQPLEGILIEVETKTPPPASAFVISGADGGFTLTLPPTPASDSLRLSARALGYAEQLVRLANCSQSVALTMREQATVLKEVVVQGAPITRSHDTLSYQVAAFANKQDRVIADVLKKMPGIEVASDGQISYEGRPISKFYINGQDLLEGRYNLASDNLPADAVQSVQVLENHQPIRALDKLIHPDNAALNLQLKKKVTATGQARLGAGLVPSPASALWNANVSPMLYTPRQQLIDTYQSNNTGQDVAAELKPLTLADLQQQSESSNQKPDLTHIQGLGQPPVAANRYLFNKVQLLSANHLVTISKEQQLRVNASYLHDEQTRRGSTRTAYYLPDGRTVALTEAKTDRLRFNTLQTDLAYIKNVKDYYLKNTLSLEGRWDAQTGDIYREEAQTRVAQAARNPFFGVTNRLGLVRPLRGGKILQVSSLVFYTNSPQRLAVSPGVFAAALTGGAATDTARQQVRQGSFFTSNSLGLTASRGHWAYSGTVGFSEEIQRLTSNLTTAPEPPPTPLPLRNDLHWARGRYYAQPGLSYKADTWNASLDAPISYYDFRASDPGFEAGQRSRVLVAAPRLNLRRDLGALWYASGGVGLNNGFGDISQFNYAYLLRDYRTLQRNDAPLPRSIGQNYHAGIYFKNPLKSLFFNANYSLNSTLTNRLYSNQVDSSGALTTVALDQDSRRVSHSAFGGVSKFSSPWKTNFSLNLTGSLSRQPQVLNGTLARTTSRTGTATFKASCSAFDWGSLDYSASFTALRSTVDGGPTPPLAVLQDHHASVSVFPVGRHALTAAADYYASRGPAAPVRAFFADLTYRYTLPTARKIDLEVRWNNIFDTRQYQYGFVNQFSLVQNTYQLRPAQVLAVMRLSL